MRLTRAFVISLAVGAMLGAPILQHNAEAQSRSGRATASARAAGRATAVPRRAIVPPRRVVVAPRRGRVVVGAYYRPLYYSRYYSPFYSPFYDPFYYGSPYRYGVYPGYAYGQFYGPESAVRLQVTPRNTEVFVDGYYAGVVDNFDGIFQRLRLEPGPHDLQLYLPGYRTFSERIFLQPDRTFSVKHEMVPLGPGETEEPRPAAANPPQELAAPSPGDGEAAPYDSFGTIIVRVQPADADVLVDGERWDGPEGDEALVLQVPPGPHRIEVRRDGYRSYAAEIDVRVGQTTPINVSLPPQ